MAIAAGARFGPYEIVAPLGAGGMGEVWRARDTRLGREVAFKALLIEGAADHERLVRFGQEARAASSLNHPNIVSIIDTGESAGVAWIAMELVEGRTLRELLAPGPLSVRRLLELAVQIADGLAKAHAAGIVHRDLKPENLMVTPDGFVKILDFGLAKRSGPASSDLLAMPTLSQSTSEGTVLGTVGYMSPEQASGLEVDYRSDQFALGTILYEMATGRRAFHAATSAQTMAAIIQDEPRPIAESNPKVPAPVRWVIERCLAKERERRYSSTSDLARELMTLRDRLSEVSTAASMEPANPRRHRIRLMLTVAATSLALGAAGGWLGSARRNTSDFPDLNAIRFRPFATDAADEHAPEWSPDGQTISYKRHEQIFVQRLDAATGTRITDVPTGCFRHSWAPDGSRILFVTPGYGSKMDLFSVSPAGGVPELVIEDAGAYSLTPDGRTLVFLRGGRSKLWMSSPPGATPKEWALSGSPDEQTFIELGFSPDGKLLALWTLSERGLRLLTASFPGGMLREVPWTPPPSVYERGSWMPDSMHYVVGGGIDRGQLRIVNVSDGSSSPLTLGTAEVHRFPAVSPDGRSVAFASGTKNLDLIEIPLDGSAARPLLASAIGESRPSWSPGARQLVYASDREGVRGIWLHSPNEGADRPVVTRRDFGGRDAQLDAPVFSPDGRFVAYQALKESGEPGLWISGVAGGPPVPLAGGKAVGLAPTWSPDGRSIAFMEGTPLGKFALARVAVGASLEPERIAEDIVGEPRWSPTGEWISYYTRDGLALVSPDGVNRRQLYSAERLGPHGWSRDGETIYSLQANSRDHAILGAIDVATGRWRPLGDLGTADDHEGFSLAPDGKSFATSVLRYSRDIWILEGLGTEESQASTR